jgi:hypothetical protein
MDKNLFFITIGPDLAQTTDAQGRPWGDPPLTAQAQAIMKLIRPLVDNPFVSTRQVHCGTGRRFIQAAQTVFPQRREFYVSPLWGDGTIKRKMKDQECIVLSTGLVLKREFLYDVLPPMISEDWTMELLRTSTIDSVFNLPDGSALFLEQRTLSILGQPPEQFQSGAVLRAHLTGVRYPLDFTLIGAPQPPLVQAA